MWGEVVQMMNFIKEWIAKPVLLLVSIPILLVFICLGFRECWQCSRVIHIFKSKKYHLMAHGFGTEDVCESCFELLKDK